MEVNRTENVFGAIREGGKTTSVSSVIIHHFLSLIIHVLRRKIYIKLVFR